MISNDKNIEILVELLKKNNINQVVISPGGTNIKFVKAIQDDPFFKCYSVVDERSAMYFAIGLYLQTGEIIAMSCTSAQATRNYIPGLTEAFYKRVPILAITMAKHPRFTYQEYMQAPDQTSLPKDCVKKSYAVPYISDENDIFHSIRVINEAILEVTHNGNGPVQLCIPSLDFALNACEPQIRKMTRYNRNSSFDELRKYLDGKKIIVVIGERRVFNEIELTAINNFVNSYNCFIYINHLSNYKGKYSLNANLTLQTMTKDEFKKYQPDIVISIGGQTGDYPLYTMISRTEFINIEHWRINEDGKVMDTYDKLTNIFEMSESEFFDRLKDENKIVDHNYFKLWENLVNKKETNMPLPFSNIAIAQYLSDKIPKNSIIQFSILNSLRVWNFYNIDSSIECYSNVGAFGIDGGMSTLIGQSVVTDKLCFLIIGDLAFLYDMNSLGIRHIKNNLRILLINNNGGIEFKLYKGDNKKIDKFIAAGNHFKNAEGWSKTCGFKYLSAGTMDEFIKNCNQFLTESDESIVFEVFVTDEDEADAYNKVVDKNSSITLDKVIEKSKNALKNEIKKIIKKSE